MTTHGHETRNPWMSRTLVKAVIGLLSTGTLALGGVGGYYYLVGQNAKADENQVSLTADVLKSYVSQEAFQIGQVTQDSITTQHFTFIERSIGNLDARIGEIQKDTKESTALLYEIKGQLGTRRTEKLNQP